MSRSASQASMSGYASNSSSRKQSVMLSARSGKKSPAAAAGALTARGDKHESRGQFKRRRMMARAGAGKEMKATLRRDRPVEKTKMTSQERAQRLLDDITWLMELNHDAGEPDDEATATINAAADVLVEAEELKERLATSYNPSYVDKEFKKLIPECGDAVRAAYDALMVRGASGLEFLKVKLNRLKERNESEHSPTDEASAQLDKATRSVEDATHARGAYDDAQHDAEQSATSSTKRRMHAMVTFAQAQADEFIACVEDAKRSIFSAGSLLMQRKLDSIKEAEAVLDTIEAKMEDLEQREEATSREGTENDAAARAMAELAQMFHAADQAHEAMVESGDSPDLADEFIAKTKTLAPAVSRAEKSLELRELAQRDQSLRELAEAEVAFQRLKARNDAAGKPTDEASATVDLLEETIAEAKEHKAKMESNPEERQWMLRLMQDIDEVKTLTGKGLRTMHDRETFSVEAAKEELAMLADRMAQIRSRDELAGSPHDNVLEPLLEAIVALDGANRSKSELNVAVLELNEPIKVSRLCGELIRNVKSVSNKLQVVLPLLDERDVKSLLEAQKHVKELRMEVPVYVALNAAMMSPDDEGTKTLSTLSFETEELGNMSQGEMDPETWASGSRLDTKSVFEYALRCKATVAARDKVKRLLREREQRLRKEFIATLAHAEAEIARVKERCTGPAWKDVTELNGLLSDATTAVVKASVARDNLKEELGHAGTLSTFFTAMAQVPTSIAAVRHLMRLRVQELTNQLTKHREALENFKRVDKEYLIAHGELKANQRRRLLRKQESAADAQVGSWFFTSGRQRFTSEFDEDESEALLRAAKQDMEDAGEAAPAPAEPDNPMPTWFFGAVDASRETANDAIERMAIDAGVKYVPLDDDAAAALSTAEAAVASAEGIHAALKDHGRLMAQAEAKRKLSSADGGDVEVDFSLEERENELQDRLLVLVPLAAAERKKLPEAFAKRYRGGMETSTDVLRVGTLDLGMCRRWHTRAVRAGVVGHSPAGPASNIVAEREARAAAIEKAEAAQAQMEAKAKALADKTDAALDAEARGEAPAESSTTVGERAGESAGAGDGSGDGGAAASAGVGKPGSPGTQDEPSSNDSPKDKDRDDARSALVAARAALDNARKALDAAHKEVEDTPRYVRTVAVFVEALSVAEIELMHLQRDTVAAAETRLAAIETAVADMEEANDNVFRPAGPETEALLKMRPGIEEVTTLSRGGEIEVRASPDEVAKLDAEAVANVGALPALPSEISPPEVASSGGKLSSSALAGLPPEVQALYSVVPGHLEYSFVERVAKLDIEASRVATMLRERNAAATAAVTKTKERVVKLSAIMDALVRRNRAHGEPDDAATAAVKAGETITATLRDLERRVVVTPTLVGDYVKFLDGADMADASIKKAREEMDERDARLLEEGRQNLQVTEKRLDAAEALHRAHGSVQDLAAEKLVNSRALLASCRDRLEAHARTSKEDRERRGSSSDILDLIQRVTDVDASATGVDNALQARQERFIQDGMAAADAARRKLEELRLRHLADEEPEDDALDAMVAATEAEKRLTIAMETLSANKFDPTAAKELMDAAEALPQAQEKMVLEFKKRAMLAEALASAQRTVADAETLLADMRVRAAVLPSNESVSATLTVAEEAFKRVKDHMDAKHADKRSKANFSQQALDILTAMAAKVADAAQSMQGEVGKHEADAVGEAERQLKGAAGIVRKLQKKNNEAGCPADSATSALAEAEAAVKHATLLHKTYVAGRESEDKHGSAARPSTDAGGKGPATSRASGPDQLKALMAAAPDALTKAQAAESKFTARAGAASLLKEAMARVDGARNVLRRANERNDAHTQAAAAASAVATALISTTEPEGSAQSTARLLEGDSAAATGMEGSTKRALEAATRDVEEAHAMAVSDKVRVAAQTFEQGVVDAFVACSLTAARSADSALREVMAREDTLITEARTQLDTFKAQLVELENRIKEAKVTPDAATRANIENARVVLSKLSDAMNGVMKAHKAAQAAAAKAEAEGAELADIRDAGVPGLAAVARLLNALPTAAPAVQRAIASGSTLTGVVSSVRETDAKIKELEKALEALEAHDESHGLPTGESAVKDSAVRAIEAAKAKLQQAIALQKTTSPEFGATDVTGEQAAAYAQAVQAAMNAAAAAQESMAGRERDMVADIDKSLAWARNEVQALKKAVIDMHGPEGLNRDDAPARALQEAVAALDRAERQRKAGGPKDKALTGALLGTVAHAVEQCREAAKKAAETIGANSAAAKREAEELARDKRLKTAELSAAQSWAMTLKARSDPEDITLPEVTDALAALEEAERLELAMKAAGDTIEATRAYTLAVGRLTQAVHRADNVLDAKRAAGDTGDADPRMVANARSSLAVARSKLDVLVARNFAAGAPEDPATTLVERAMGAVTFAESYEDKLLSIADTRASKGGRRGGGSAFPRQFVEEEFVPAVQEALLAIDMAKQAMASRQDMAVRALQLSASTAAASLALSVCLRRLTALKTDQRLPAAGLTGGTSSSSSSILRKASELARLCENLHVQLTKATNFEDITEQFISQVLRLTRLLKSAEASTFSDFMNSWKFQISSEHDNGAVADAALQLERAGKALRVLRAQNREMGMPSASCNKKITTAMSVLIAAETSQNLLFSSYEPADVAKFYTEYVPKVVTAVREAELAVKQMVQAQKQGGVQRKVTMTDPADWRKGASDAAHDRRFTGLVNDLGDLMGDMRDLKSRYSASEAYLKHVPDMGLQMEFIKDAMAVAQVIADAAGADVDEDEPGPSLSRRESSRQLSSRSTGKASSGRGSMRRLGSQRSVGMGSVAVQRDAPVWVVAPAVIDQFETSVITVRVAIAAAKVLFDHSMKPSGTLQASLRKAREPLSDVMAKASKAIRAVEGELEGAQETLMEMVARSKGIDASHAPDLPVEMVEGLRAAEMAASNGASTVRAAFDQMAKFDDARHVSVAALLALVDKVAVAKGTVRGTTDNTTDIKTMSTRMHDTALDRISNVVAQSGRGLQMYRVRLAALEVTFQRHQGDRGTRDAIMAARTTLSAAELGVSELMGHVASLSKLESDAAKVRLARSGRKQSRRSMTAVAAGAGGADVDPDAVEDDGGVTYGELLEAWIMACMVELMSSAASILTKDAEVRHQRGTRLSALKNDSNPLQAYAYARLALAHKIYEKHAPVAETRLAQGDRLDPMHIKLEAALSESKHAVTEAESALIGLRNAVKFEKDDPKAAAEARDTFALAVANAVGAVDTLGQLLASDEVDPSAERGFTVGVGVVPILESPFRSRAGSTEQSGPSSRHTSKLSGGSGSNRLSASGEYRSDTSGTSSRKRSAHDEANALLRQAQRRTRGLSASNSITGSPYGVYSPHTPFESFDDAAMRNAVFYDNSSGRSRASSTSSAGLPPNTLVEGHRSTAVALVDTVTLRPRGSIESRGVLGLDPASIGTYRNYDTMAPHLLKPQFADLVLRLRHVGVRYRFLISEVRKANMTVVPVEVGRPMATELKHATSKLSAADMAVPRNVAQRKDFKPTGRQITEWEEVVRRAAMAVFRFEGKMLDVYKNLQQILLSDHIVELRVGLKEAQLMFEEDMSSAQMQHRRPYHHWKHDAPDEKLVQAQIQKASKSDVFNTPLFRRHVVKGEALAAQPQVATWYEAPAESRRRVGRGGRAALPAPAAAAAAVQRKGLSRTASMRTRLDGVESFSLRGKRGGSNGSNTSSPASSTGRSAVAVPHLALPSLIADMSAPLPGPDSAGSPGPGSGSRPKRFNIGGADGSGAGKGLAKFASMRDVSSASGNTSPLLLSSLGKGGSAKGAGKLSAESGSPSSPDRMFGNGGGIAVGGTAAAARAEAKRALAASSTPPLPIGTRSPVVGSMGSISSNGSVRSLGSNGSSRRVKVPKMRATETQMSPLQSPAATAEPDTPAPPVMLADPLKIDVSPTLYEEDGPDGDHPVDSPSSHVRSVHEIHRVPSNRLLDAKTEAGLKDEIKRIPSVNSMGSSDPSMAPSAKIMAKVASGRGFGLSVAKQKQGPGGAGVRRGGGESSRNTSDSGTPGSDGRSPTVRKSHGGSASSSRVDSPLVPSGAGAGAEDSPGEIGVPVAPAGNRARLESQAGTVVSGDAIEAKSVASGEYWSSDESEASDIEDSPAKEGASDALIAAAAAAELDGEDDTLRPLVSVDGIAASADTIRSSRSSLPGETPIAPVGGGALTDSNDSAHSGYRPSGAATSASTSIASDGLVAERGRANARFGVPPAKIALR